MRRSTPSRARVVPKVLISPLVSIALDTGLPHGHLATAAPASFDIFRRAATLLKTQLVGKGFSRGGEVVDRCVGGCRFLWPPFDVLVEARVHASRPSAGFGKPDQSKRRHSMRLM